MTTATTTAKTPKKAVGMIHLKWVVSGCQAPMHHKLVIRGLGFTRLNQVIERQDTPEIRGMVAKVPHLVTVVKSAS